MNDIRISSGDWSIAATVSGRDPRIVLLHPGVGDRRCWYGVMAALAPSLAAVAYDMRGFGGTPPAIAPFVNVDDLRAVLDATVTGPAVLIGNSQGGRVAIDFALHHPERVDRLSLIASAVSGAPEVDWVAELGQPLFDQLEAAEDAGDLDQVNRIEARIWLDGPAGPEGRVGGAARELFLAMNRIPLTNESAPQPLEPPSAFEQLEHLTMPVLVMVGTLDLPHQSVRSRRIAARVANGRLVELEGVAHLPQLEQPTQVADAIRAFVLDDGEISTWMHRQ